MLTLREVRALVGSVSPERFVRELGPFTLIQRPVSLPGTGTQQMGVPPSARSTQSAKPGEMQIGALSLLFEFDELLVATLPPVEGATQLTVGRLPDSDLVLDHASVSKRHAVLHWRHTEGRCLVEDLGSTNGTFLDASVRLKSPTVLRDGDILSFGEVPFWFLLTLTLYERFRSGEGTAKLGSRSG